MSGRVLAVDGTPAINIRVTAIASLTQTDSAGRYRLENIPPGRYYIAAGLLNLSHVLSRDYGSPYCDASFRWRRSNRENIDFSMVKGTGAKVSGRLAVFS